MRFFSIIVTALTAVCLSAQPPATPAKDAPGSEAKGFPPRTAPTDYQAHAAAGNITIAAELMGHSILTPDGTTYTNDEYIAVETGIYGPDGTRLKISNSDFTLRISGKKTTEVNCSPFGVVFRQLKDPVWEDKVAVEQKEQKSGSGISTGGKSQDAPAPPPKMPLEMQRAMQQRVQKSAMPEGERALPQAGLLFFLYRGKVEHIRSAELVYSGPAGTATLALQP